MDYPLILDLSNLQAMEISSTTSAVLHITLLSGRSEDFVVDLCSTVEELKARAQTSFGQGEGDVGNKA